MSASRAIKYLVCTILLFGFLILSEAVLFAIRNKTVGAFHLLPYYLAVYLMEILFGALLGLEQLLKQRRQDGRWSVNIEKLVFLGLLPLAFYTFWLLIYGQVIHIPVNGFFVNYVLGGTLILGYAGVVSGYALITSFKKSERAVPVAAEL